MEKKLDEILQELRLIRQQLSQIQPNLYKTSVDCACPPSYMCMNVACPRKLKVTC